MWQSKPNKIGLKWEVFSDKGMAASEACEDQEADRGRGYEI